MLWPRCREHCTFPVLDIFLKYSPLNLFVLSYQTISNIEVWKQWISTYNTAHWIHSIPSHHSIYIPHCPFIPYSLLAIIVCYKALLWRPWLRLIAVSFLWSCWVVTVVAILVYIIQLFTHHSIVHCEWGWVFANNIRTRLVCELNVIIHCLCVSVRQVCFYCVNTGIFICMQNEQCQMYNLVSWARRMSLKYMDMLRFGWYM